MTERYSAYQKRVHEFITAKDKTYFTSVNPENFCRTFLESPSGLGLRKPGTKEQMNWCKKKI
ncbi:hypothetical protein LCGC14_1833060 [marine sediment metagenome]|uniref:Uncharacterized protein n=1 Tax=marine sediment metagenome TaxID=412755 RepID=A0A0F9GFN7_9ZZZZ